MTNVLTIMKNKNAFKLKIIKIWSSICAFIAVCSKNNSFNHVKESNILPYLWIFIEPFGPDMAPADPFNAGLGLYSV